MKNNLRNIFAAGLLVLAGAVAARAQQADQKVTFKAPFEFQVENGRLPAGEYTLLVQNGWLQIQAKNGKSNANVLTLPVSRKGKQPSESAAAVFHQYNGRYFLAEIWAAGPDNGRQLLESHEEQQIAKEQKMVSVRVPITTAQAK